jgi:hypothetical protein
MLACFFLVIATHMMLATNLLAFGGLRNLKFVTHKPSPPADLHPVDPAVVDAIQSAHQIYIPYAHWEVLYWNFMRFNPAASYRTGLELNSPASDLLMLVSTAPEHDVDLLPAKLPAGNVPGLVYVGLASGDQIFATGAHLESKYPSRRAYTVIPFTWAFDNASGTRIGVHTGGFRENVQSLACCIGIRPEDGVELRYELQSTRTGRQLDHDWFLPGQSDHGLSLDPIAEYDTLAIETRSVKQPDEIVRTVHRLSSGAYTVGGNEMTYSGNRLPLASIPTLAPEPYEQGGKRYTVSWLGKDTSISVFNPGQETEATLELQLATFGKPHTAVLVRDGIAIASPAQISRIFWVNGAEAVQFDVRLAARENRFVLRSKDSPDELPGGRQVCFLLIGDVKVVAKR